LVHHSTNTVLHYGVRKLACALVRRSLLRQGNAREASRDESGSKLASCRTANGLKYVTVFICETHSLGKG
jgi:hypothetical protein